MAEITMPKMSDAMEEGTVIKWLKHEGDQVEKGEPIAQIETEKATLEIESFETGIIQELKTKEGETVPVGTPIAVVSTDGKPSAAAAPSAEAPSEAETPQAVEEPPPAPPEPPKAGPPPSPPPAAPPPPRAAEDEDRIKASPLAHKMAKDAGLDLRELTGTGPSGRIVEADIREHLQSGKAPIPAPPQVERAEPPAAPPSPAPAAAGAEPAGEAELSRVRKIVAKRMTQSKQTIPHFYVTTEVKMDQALKLRESLNEVRDKHSRISLNDFITKACAMALMRVPEVNASWHDDKLQYHEHANIGIAVALDEGLIVPVVPECDVKSLSEVAAKSHELIAKARSGQIHPDELAGATFTISNLGMFDVEDFVAIIVPPESAILAVASAIPRPVVVDDKVEIVRTMKMTISADHRVTDGVGAARFLREVKRLLERPYLLLQ